MKKSILLSAACMSMAVLAADNLPQLKEGLWAVSTETTSKPGDSKIEGTSSICRDHAYDEKARARTKTGMKSCTVTSEKFENGTYTLVSHCEVPGHVIDSTAVTTITSDTATHTESHTTFKPALGGRDETTMVMDEKYSGSCPAGMAPGDRTTKDGQVIHMAKPSN